MLAEHFLALHARRYGRQGVRFSEGALARIRTHAWPGNVRELRNVVEQALLCSRGDRIEETHLGITPASDILSATSSAAAPGRIEMAQSVNGTDLAAGTLDDAER